MDFGVANVKAEKRRVSGGGFGVLAVMSSRLKEVKVPIWSKSLRCHEGDLADLE
jgi:hypothetical protein